MNSSFYCVQNKKGFTLLEILLVVGIIAILAGIVIVAINPSKMLAQVRDTERKVGLSEINKALSQYYIDKGQLPNSVSNSLNDICDTGSNASSTQAGINCAGFIDLSMLVPTYLPAIPKDPQASTTHSTGYFVAKNSSGNIVLTAPSTELGNVIVVGKPDPTYIITFNSNLGTGSMSPQSINQNATANLIINGGSITRTNYTFSGWNTLANGLGTAYADQAPYTMGVANVILYAKWTLIDACTHIATNANCWSPDRGMMAWSAGMQPTVNASSTTNGFINTQLVKNSFTIANYPGFNTCYNYNDGVHPVGTWYLPAEQELVSAVQNGVGGWQSGVWNYWSSTEDTYGNPGSYSMLVRSTTAYVFPDIKTYASAYRVRCLR